MGWRQTQITHNIFMRFLLALFLTFPFLSFAAPPPIQYNMFSTNRIGNTNQFNQSAGNVHIKDWVRLTNSYRWFTNDAVMQREPFWWGDGGSRYILYNSATNTIFQVRPDAHPNKGFYIGDELTSASRGNDFISLRARGYADQTNTYPYSPRITFEFGANDFREWAFDDFLFSYKVGEGGSKYDVLHFTIDGSEMTNGNRFATNYLLGREIFSLTNMTFLSSNGVFGLAPDSIFASKKVLLIRSENDGSGNDNISIGDLGIGGAAFINTPGTVIAGYFEQNTNAVASWPPNPARRGSYAVVNSNGTPYVILSGPNSPTWASTNLLLGGGSGGSTNMVFQNGGVLDMNDQTGLTGGAAAAAAVPTRISQLAFSHFGTPYYTWYPYMAYGLSAGNSSPNVSFDFAQPANFGTSAGYETAGPQWTFNVNHHPGNQTNNISTDSDGIIIGRNESPYKYTQIGMFGTKGDGTADLGNWAAIGVGNALVHDEAFAGQGFIVMGDTIHHFCIASTGDILGGTNSGRQMVDFDFLNRNTHFLFPILNIASSTNAASRDAFLVAQKVGNIVTMSNASSRSVTATNWGLIGPAAGYTGSFVPPGSAGNTFTEFNSNILFMVEGNMVVDATGIPGSAAVGVDGLSSQKLRVGLVKQGANYPMLASASGAPLILAAGSTDNLLNSNSVYTPTLAIASDGSVTNVSLTGSGRRLVEADANGKLYAILATNAAGGGGGFFGDPTQLGGPAGGTNIISGATMTNIMIRPASTVGNGLTIKGLTSQVSDLLMLQDASGNTVSSLFAAGGAGFNGHVVIDNSNGVAVVALAVSNSSTVATAPLAQFTGTNGGVFQIQAGSDVSSVAITNSGGFKVGGNAYLVGNVAIDGAAVTMPNADLTIASGGVFNFGPAGSGRTRMTSLANGTLEFVNTAANDFTRFQLGGSSAAFPSLGRQNGDLIVSDGPGTGTTNKLRVSGGIHFSQQSAPTAAAIGGTVGSVTNHVLLNVNGALTAYWSDGTTLWSKILAP